MQWNPTTWASKKPSNLEIFSSRMTHAKPSTCMESLGQLAPVSFWRLHSLLDPWTHHLQCDNHTCYMTTHLNVTLSSTANEDCVQLHVLRTNIRRVHDQKYLSNNWIYCGIRSCKRPDHKKNAFTDPNSLHMIFLWSRWVQFWQWLTQKQLHSCPLQSHEGHWCKYWNITNRHEFSNLCLWYTRTKI